MTTRRDLSNYYTNGKPGFEPAKAHTSTQGIPPTHTWLEPKLDGARALVFVRFEKEAEVVITSRRTGKAGTHRQWQDNLPDIVESLRPLKEHGAYLLDCEVMHKSLSSTMSIVGAGAQKARDFQREHGPAKLHVFDCLVMSGWDITQDPLYSRSSLVDELVDWLDAPEGLVQVVPSKIVEYENIQSELHNLSQTYEGAVAKDPDSKYWDSKAWYKWKPTKTLDVQVIGYVPGKGKYTGTVGSLKVAVLSGGRLKEIGTVSPGTDQDRAYYMDLLHKYGPDSIPSLRIILEIEYQEIGARGGLRHPRVIRKRLDKGWPSDESEVR